MPLRMDCIHQGDCLDLLNQVKGESVDLAFADPPFNIGYEYDEYDDRRPRERYLDWSRDWIAAVYRVLKPNGTFWLAIGDEYAAELKLIAQDQAGFHSRSWVIWYYTFGVNCTRKFNRSHAHLFHFVKDPKDFTFNANDPAIRVPSARQLVYADGRANPKGRLPDDTWILRPQDVEDGFAADQDTWYFPRVAGTFKERAGFHGCQMPEQLLGRIIRTCSDRGEIVLDPFAGSGTTLVVAKKLRRRWIGTELSKEYARRAQQRVDAANDGDTLDGAADPQTSAPATNRKVRSARRANKRVTKSRVTPKHESDANAGPATITNGSNDRLLIEAYNRTCRGYSTDRLLADPELNEQFAETCHRLGAHGRPLDWNWRLLRLRKSGKLPTHGSAKRLTLAPDHVDQFEFASEIALEIATREHGLSLDRILCDPTMAAEFDKTAERFAPGYTPLEYRWVALRIRKRAKIWRGFASEYCSNENRIELPQTRSIKKLRIGEFDAIPGVYVLGNGNGRRELYVGRTLDLANRLRQCLHDPVADAWSEYRPKGVCIMPVLGRPESTRRGMQSWLIGRRSPIPKLNFEQLAVS